MDFSNSSRLDMLTRQGQIYLTLQDAIALALENNLDIESARYLHRLAEADKLRAASGAFIRSTPTNIVAGPSSASGTLAVSGPLSSPANSAGGVGGLAPVPAIESAGTPLPRLDPVVFADGLFGHQTLPQANSILTGTNSLNTDLRQWNYGISKSFQMGTSASFNWANTRLFQNAPNNDLNPATLASVGIDIRQPLLRGFGRKLNTRVIRIANNNRAGADLTFRAQVIATVFNVINLYYDLVAFHDQLRVRRNAYEISVKIFNDNKREVAIGTLASSDLERSQSEIFAAEQEVAAAETQVFQQEMLLKNVLTRSGIDSLGLVSARLIPLDRFPVPRVESVESAPDLVQKALAERPEVLQSLLQIQNKTLSMLGTRDAVRPSLDVTLSVRNNGLAGALNQLAGRGTSPLAADPFFLGNYGTVLRQLAGRNFPDYLAGFSLSIPLLNRTARADLARDQADLRLQEIALQKLRNAIKLDVLNSQLAVTKAREAYDSSVRASEVTEKNYQTELRKISLGASSTLEVILARRDLTLRQLAGVAALNTYARARNGLSAIVGNLLEEYQVSIEEAFSGVVARPSSPPPPAAEKPQAERKVQ